MRQNRLSARTHIIGVIGNRSHLAGEFGGRHDADAGNAQEQHVRGAYQQAGHLLFELGDLLESQAPVIIML